MVFEVPPGLDYAAPNVARVYDYLLGGKDHVTADRVFAEKLIAQEPAVRLLAETNRAFLQRAVKHLADAGIRQFVDVGTGLPTCGHVHEHVPSDSRVVYVDIDPVVLAHARALIAGRAGATIVEGDLRRPHRLLDHLQAEGVIDFDEPYAVVLCAVVHFLNEEDTPDGVIATIRERMAPGSYLVLTHATGDVPEAATKASAVRDLYDQTDRPGTLRPLHRIRGFFQGLEVLEPGVVPVSSWRPTQQHDIDPEHVWLYGGVGRKPSARGT